MLNRDFKEFIESLNKHKVRYLVVGGYAVAFHGYPRYTKDLDIWIELSPDNAENALKALEEFGFESVGLKKEDFLEEDQVIQLGAFSNSRIPGDSFIDRAIGTYFYIVFNNYSSAGNQFIKTFGAVLVIKSVSTQNSS